MASGKAEQPLLTNEQIFQDHLKDLFLQADNLAALH
jgi:hypothetical protein